MRLFLRLPLHHHHPTLMSSPTDSQPPGGGLRRVLGSLKRRASSAVRRASRIDQSYFYPDSKPLPALPPNDEWRAESRSLDAMDLSRSMDQQPPGNRASPGGAVYHHPRHSLPAIHEDWTRQPSIWDTGKLTHPLIKYH